MNLPTPQEKISTMTTSELIQMSEELHTQFIPSDALIRKVCTEVYVNRVNTPDTVTVLEMMIMAPHIAYELGQRIKNNNI